MKTLIRLLCLSVLWFSCEEQNQEVEGCTYDDACNFNENATLDDGSCTFSGTNFDCEGNCIDIDLDETCDYIDSCIGWYDECWNCRLIDIDFDNIIDEYDDCIDYENDGICDGVQVETIETCDDDCGIPNGDNSSCTGCLDEESEYYCSDCLFECDDNCCFYDVELDLNGDDSINVLDVVFIINMILNSTEMNLNVDFNQDGLVNVLEASHLVYIILDGFGRGQAANLVTVFINDNQVDINGDGEILGIQMTLSHDANFVIDLTDDALVSEYKREGNYTKLVVMVPENETLFSSDGTFEIIDIIAADGWYYIDTFIIYE